MIQKLKHHQIDKTKWDEVITSSDNPHIYALSWYLDIVSPNWEGYVFDDYKWVMPLPLKHKWGLPYLVQPVFCQQLGIFGIGVKSAVARKFYKKLFWPYPYFNLQFGNALGLERRKHLNGKINYTLDLSPPYATLLKDYKGNAHRNIKKAKQHRLTLHHANGDEIAGFCEKNMKGISGNSNTLKNLVNAVVQRQLAHTVKVKDEKSEVLAVACFMVWNKTIFYFAGASSPRGKELSAMFLVLDSVIQKHAESGWLLDFEGSMIPGIASFFRDFGAKASFYYHLKKYLFFYR